MLENFPKSREQWAAVEEGTSKQIRPDIIVSLVDSSPNGEALFERWLSLHPKEAAFLAVQAPTKESKGSTESLDGEQGEAKKVSDVENSYF